MGGSILSSLERRKGHYMKVFQLKAEEKRKILMQREKSKMFHQGEVGI